MGRCRQVVGFDMVDDESKPERRPAKHMQSPAQWDLKHNPAYNYYCFYIYANLYILNKLREARGLNTFALRPHAGAPSGICALLLAACGARVSAVWRSAWEQSSVQTPDDPRVTRAF